LVIAVNTSNRSAGHVEAVRRGDELGAAGSGQRRQQVGVGVHAVDAHLPAGAAGRPDDERHPDHAFVDDLVAVAALLAELVAVVGGQDHQRVVRQAQRVETRQQRVEQEVGEEHLAVVELAQPSGVGFGGRVGVATAVLLVRPLVAGAVEVLGHRARRIRRVRRDEVNPAEERLAAVRGQHLGGLVDDPAVRWHLEHPVVVEPLAEVALVDHLDIVDHGERLPAGALHDLGQRLRVAQVPVAKDPERPLPGESGGERRRRGLGGDVEPIEHERVGGPVVDVGRGVQLVAVDAQRVGPERVEADDEDVGVGTDCGHGLGEARIGRLGRLGRPAAADRQARRNPERCRDGCTDAHRFPPWPAGRTPCPSRKATRCAGGRRPRAPTL
jgi:hypothetical protein